jgi:uroporphyrinogen decarboxylase
MNKRERLERTIAGEPTDRVPVSLWRHFPGDDQRAADLARSTVDFQRAYDWDFVKVTPASSFCLTDYGVQDQWEGSLEGTRVYTRRVIQKSLDWTGLRSLDPARGGLGRQAECLRLITDDLGEEVPVVQTIFSPLAQAKNLAGKEMLLRHMRLNPDRVHSGLATLTESTLRFIDSLRRLPLAGIFYAVQHANYDTLSEDEYRQFGLVYDKKILDALPSKWWLNLTHLHGEAPMFKFAHEFKTQVINWHDRKCEPDLAIGKTLVNGAVCGGLAQWEHLHQGAPTTVRDAARDAVHQTNARRFILSTGCVTLITTPLSNLRAARESVEST